LNNVATAQFSDSVYTVSTPLWRYDYGQVLKIEGLPLPDPFEVHFSYAPVGTAKYQIGRNGQVTIPDEFLTKSGFAYAWIFLHTGEDDGETRYQIKIPVRERAKPTDTPLTPEEQSIVTQLIAVLNEKVNQAEEAKDAAQTALQGMVYVTFETDSNGHIVLKNGDLIGSTLFMLHENGHMEVIY